MPKYLSRTYTPDTYPAYPAISPLTGLRVMARNPSAAVTRAQDRLVGLTRRLVARQSLGQSSGWLSDTTAPWPVYSTVRTVARSRFSLTPGCYLRAWILCGKAGEADNGAGGQHGATGLVRIVATYRNGVDTETVTREYSTPPSTLDDGGAASGTGALWTEITRAAIAEIEPPTIWQSVTDSYKWSKGARVTCEVAIQHVGSPRVIDCAVYETPRLITAEVDDSTFVAHNAATSPTYTHPIQRRSEVTPDGDPRDGTWHVMDVIAGQSARIGPTLVHWTSYAEHTASTTATESSPVTTTSATFVPLLSSGAYSYSTSTPGLPIASGGLARLWITDAAIALHERVAAVPVWVWVYAGQSAGTGTVRIDTGRGAWVDVSITGSAQWYSAPGWLRCGIVPEQSGQHVQAALKCTAGTLSVYAILVEWRSV